MNGPTQEQALLPQATNELDWGNARVPWNFNLRLTEPHQMKLQFILDNSRERSMHKMLNKLVDGFIEVELNKLLQAGLTPGNP